MTEKIIMFDDAEAAQPYTMTGWKSRNGLFYGDEQSARYDGSTHVKCKYCGEPTKKHYTACDKCREIKTIERYSAMPRAEWDGKAMLYSDARDEYYADMDSVEDCLDEGETIESLRLIICKPNGVMPLDSDYCSDDLADDMELPDEAWKAMDAFNKAVSGIVLSWSPSKFALKVG